MILCIFLVQFITLHNQGVWIVHLVCLLGDINLNKWYANSCRILKFLEICIHSATPLFAA